MLQVLRLPLFQLPQLITQLVNAQVSIKRIEEFLAAPKSDPLEQLPAAAPGRPPLTCRLLECNSTCLTFFSDTTSTCASCPAVLSMRRHLQINTFIYSHTGYAKELVCTLACA